MNDLDLFLVSKIGSYLEINDVIDYGLTSQSNRDLIPVLFNDMTVYNSQLNKIPKIYRPFVKKIRYVLELYHTDETSYKRISLEEFSNLRTIRVPSDMFIGLLDITNNLNLREIHVINNTMQDKLMTTIHHNNNIKIILVKADSIDALDFAEYYNKICRLLGCSPLHY